jgi:hypothetical protein
MRRLTVLKLFSLAHPGSEQGIFTEGEGSVQLTSLYKLTAFNNNTFYLQKSNLNEEVNCNETFLLGSS